MRIGVDACCWSSRRGFGRFTRELVTHMVAGHPQHEFTLVVDGATASQWRLPPQARLRAVATREQPTRAASAASARNPADVWRLSREASRHALDVFFFPAVYSYYPLLRRVPTVVAFHDAIAERHPDMVFPTLRSRLLWNLKTRLARRQADLVLTVSESAKVQIMAAFSIPESAIRVIPEAAAAVFQPLADSQVIRRVCERYRLPADRPLVLYVGGLSPHKNLLGLLAAVARLEGPAWHLALVGDLGADGFHGCYPQLQEACRALGLDGRVTFTGYVPDEDLVALYAAATVFVLPSFTEGFGLPALEAMACGVPVASSQDASLREVLGPAAIFFDPHDIDEMARALRRLLDDPGLRARLRSEGIERARAYSWTDAARGAVRVCEEAAGAR